MVRSLWKGKNLGGVQEVVWKRGTKILSQHVGQVYKVHNGQKFVEVLVEEGMVGKSFGSFSVTRHMGVDIHIKKKKRKSKGNKWEDS